MKYYTTYPHPPSKLTAAERFRLFFDIFNYTALPFYCFSRFNLPLHFTESTLVSGNIMPRHIVDLNDYVVEDWPSTSEGLERQAQEIETHYRTLFENPNIKSITWWGFTDGGWLKAPSG